MNGSVGSRLLRAGRHREGMCGDRSNAMTLARSAIRLDGDPGVWYELSGHTMSRLVLIGSIIIISPAVSRERCCAVRT